MRTKVSEHEQTVASTQARKTHTTLGVALFAGFADRLLKDALPAQVVLRLACFPEIPTKEGDRAVAAEDAPVSDVPQRETPPAAGCLALEDWGAAAGWRVFYKHRLEFCRTSVRMAVAIPVRIRAVGCGEREVYPWDRDAGHNEVQQPVAECPSDHGSSHV